MGPVAKLWVLSDLDRNEDVVGQFIPQDVTKTVSGSIAHGAVTGGQHPILQWVAGDVEIVTFRAKLWAADSTDLTVEDRLERLEGLVKRAADLGRPPVCAFSWGFLGTLTLDCLVKSLGGVTYDEVRPDGSLRGASLTITLERYEAPELTITDPSVPEKFTRVRRARRGDTYESVALEEYGDALLGVLLRQLNPRVPGMQLADLRARDPIHVFPEEYLRTLRIEPKFHAFRSGPGHEAAEERRRALLDLRARDAFTTDLPGLAEPEES
jgi:hypothetical protein